MPAAQTPDQSGQLTQNQLLTDVPLEIPPPAPSPHRGAGAPRWEFASYPQPPSMADSLPSAPLPTPELETIRIGISACLLGREVRFDGGHKLDRFLRDTLGAYVDFVPVCPEVEIGLGVPRETLRLVGDDASRPRLLAPKSQSDHSEAMRAYAGAKVEALAAAELCGYILKKGSPSCGMERVKVYPPEGGGPPRRDGRGVFAAALLERLPLLPVEEEGRLNDPSLRENFIERVFAYRRLRRFFGGPWTLGDLVHFHATEKLLLMSHSSYRELGQLVAGGKHIARDELAARYQSLFLQAIAQPTTVGKHVNVLQHIAGYFRDELDDASRGELHDLIGAYRQGLIPLIVPLTLLVHHIRVLDLDYLGGQSYLHPHPRELMLRNHV